MDQAEGLRRLAKKHGLIHPARGLMNHGKLRALVVASGKGGVGKTNTVANLAYSLSEMGKRVLVFDADMGLGNIHILLGLAPRHNIQHVINGEKTLEDIIVRGPGGIDVLPAGSGHRRYSELSGAEMLTLKTELEVLEADYDFILFDLGAGISSNVMYFCSAAREVAIITNTEPTAFADAYAIMKVLSRDYDQRDFKLIVNSVRSQRDATAVHGRLEQVADRFNLNIRIDLMGHIVHDESVRKAVREQRLFAAMFPDSKVTECIRDLAKTLIKASAPVETQRWSRVYVL